jgi:glycosyltransferase involved in cell wall biosynthesis
LLPHVEKKSAQRVYRIRAQKPCSPNCPLCLRLGLVSPHSATEKTVTSKLSKAAHGEYSHVLFPYVDTEAILEEVHRSYKSKLKTFLQIHPLCLSNFLNAPRKLSESEFQFAFTTTDVVPWDSLQGIFSSFLFVPSGNIEQIFRKLLEIPGWAREKLFFYFTPKVKEFESCLSVNEIYTLIKIVHNRISDLKVCPFPGFEIFEPRIPSDLDLQPNSELVLDQCKSNPVKFSIIIPTINQGSSLLLTIEFLRRQSNSALPFEIIIVDDGSDDGSLQMVEATLRSQFQTLDLKLISCARSSRKKSGDFSFRAASARNTGVQVCRGEYLIFLDCDMLVSPLFLERIQQNLNLGDVVQIQRQHLKPDVLPNEIHFNEETLQTKTYFRFHDAGLDFYRDGQGTRWNLLPFPWYYVSSYGLAMKATNFKKAGWFNKAFGTYGFEDVDLGYRLKKHLQSSFYLSQETSYHQWTETSRSEFSHTEFEKFRMLSYTAKTFFLNTLDTEIYESARIFMG